MHNYFSHDSNARNDEKLVCLRMKHGAAGYGVYFMILERMRDEKNYKCARDYNMIAFDLRVDAGLVKSVVENFGLFQFEEENGQKLFYSKSFLDRMEKRDNVSRVRAEAGKKGGASRRKTDDTDGEEGDDEQTSPPPPPHLALNGTKPLTFDEFSKWLKKNAPELLQMRTPDEEGWLKVKCLYNTRKKLEKACLEIAANEPFRKKWKYFVVAMEKWKENERRMHPEIIQQEEEELRNMRQKAIQREYEQNHQQPTKTTEQ